MIQVEIERLIAFGLTKGLIEQPDQIPVRNALLDLLCVSEPYAGQVTCGEETAGPMLERILDYSAETGLLPQNSMGYRDALGARIMGLLTPRQSEVVKGFFAACQISPALATDWFYQLSRAANYIQVDRVRQNICWAGETAYGNLEITINVSKPEKDPRDIIAAKHLPQTSYPKCLLCPENAGFAGTLTHPARQNHRIIPLTLHGDPWYFQYSPYVYYNEHCIVLDQIHRPMKIEEATFWRLFDFLDQFPHYFIGSNADLPIVGGSLLSHDHFQGGRHVFPMEKAGPYRLFTHRDFQTLTVSLVKWPMSVIRIAGAQKAPLVALAMHILEGWRGYSHPAAQILSHSGSTPHNTVTPIARKNREGLYELDMVLRNNRTTEAHPLGLFHPHESLHHIKKENIGLIEVMGLAVLPGRLRETFGEIKEMLQSRKPFHPRPFEDPAHPLHKHLDWIVYLLRQYGTENSAFDADCILKQETAMVFQQVLADAGVFKDTELGRGQFASCMKALGFLEL